MYPIAEIDNCNNAGPMYLYATRDFFHDQLMPSALSGTFTFLLRP
jgi:hypothetical protein